MNKKNIILGLSLILSSVATLNLASCQNDDDDDANHAPKGVTIDTFSTKMGADVKNYVADQLKGTSAKVSVKETRDEFTIKVTANASQEKEITKKLVAVCKTDTVVLNMIQKYAPLARLTMFHNVNDATKSNYEITYDL